MTSRDFGIVTLRSAVAYRRNNTLVPPNNVYVTSTNGAAIFSDTLTISTINVSTINGGGVGGGVSSITAGTNISITGTVSTPIVNVDINSTLLMNGFPIYDNSTITIAAGSTINLSTLNTSIYLDQVSQGIILTANNGININASTLFNGSIKVASTFYDNNVFSGTSGQVLTAGTGGQVIWSTISGGGGDTFWASTLSNGGITNTNTGIVYISTSLIVRPPAGEALIEIVARDGANAAALHWEQSTIGVALDMNLQANGVTIMAPYGSAGNDLITIGDPRGSVGPPILPANSEIFGFTSGYQAGTATIGAGTPSVSIFNTNITSNSIVLAWIQEFFDNTLTAVQVGLVNGSGFTILGNANATGAVSVAYFIFRY